MLSLSTLAQVPATLPDVWVDQVTTTNMGVPVHMPDDVVVNCDMIKTLHDQITDMAGRVMLQGTTQGKEIDIRSLSSGMYWLQIPGNPTQKFLKR